MVEKRLTFTIWLLSSSELEALRVSVCACVYGQVWGEGRVMVSLKTV